MSRFKNCEKPHIKYCELTKYNFMVQYIMNLKLAKFTYIGSFTYINSKNCVVIDEYVHVFSHCSIYSSVKRDICIQSYDRRWNDSLTANNHLNPTSERPCFACIFLTHKVNRMCRPYPSFQRCKFPASAPARTLIPPGTSCIELALDYDTRYMNRFWIFVRLRVCILRVEWIRWRLW